MSKQNILFVLSFALICFTDSAPPSFLTKCKSDDSECIKETTKAAIKPFAAGLPEYNVPSLDPTTFKVINATQGDLLFVLRDVTAVGLSKCEVKKIERDVPKSKLYIKLLCTGQLDGQYELKGNLLFLPIEGEGAIHVLLRAALVSIELDLVDKTGDDGKKHWQIKSWTHSFELKDKSNVVFENLYKDNEVLGRAASELVANNGNDIVMEIGPPVVKALIARVVKFINIFFKAVPYNDFSED